MKKIMLGTSDVWSMSRSSHRPSIFIILNIVGFLKIRTAPSEIISTIVSPKLYYTKLGTSEKGNVDRVFSLVYSYLALL